MASTSDSKEVIKQFFNSLSEIKKNIEWKHYSIYSAHECLFPLDIQAKAAAAGKCATVVTCFSEAGHFIPPFVIFKGKRLVPETVDSLPRGSEIAVSESGKQTLKTFKDWLDHFNAFRLKNPCILILHDHEILGMTEDWKSYCRSNCQIFPIHVSGITSKALEPLYIDIIKKLRSSYVQAAASWVESHGRVPFKNLDFGDIITPAWRRAERVENAKAGFRDSGIQPWNPHAILDKLPETKPMNNEATRISHFINPNPSGMLCQNISQSSSLNPVLGNLTSPGPHQKKLIDISPGIKTNPNPGEAVARVPFSTSPVAKPKKPAQKRKKPCKLNSDLFDWASQSSPEPQASTSTGFSVLAGRTSQFATSAGMFQAASTSGAMTACAFAGSAKPTQKWSPKKVNLSSPRKSNSNPEDAVSHFKLQQSFSLFSPK